jgi:hypothetical protein
MSKQKERSMRMLEAYAIQCTRCAVCWWRKYRPGRRCELHHIVGRRGKDPHHHRNIIMVCDQCHYGYHSGGQKALTLGQILKAKEEEDGEVDIPFLAGLCGKVGLREDPSPLPEWAIQEREINANK